MGRTRILLKVAVLGSILGWSSSSSWLALGRGSELSVAIPPALPAAVLSSSCCL